MAASSSDTKSSPSEKPLGKSEDGAKTEDEVGGAAAARSPAATTPVTTPVATSATVTALLMPTYESVQASQHYSVAKTLLNNGDFEDALQTIEEGLELTRAILLSEGGLPEEALAVHPALGVRCAMLDSLCVCVVEMERVCSGSNSSCAGKAMLCQVVLVLCACLLLELPSHSQVPTLFFVDAALSLPVRYHGTYGMFHTRGTNTTHAPASPHTRSSISFQPSPQLLYSIEESTDDLQPMTLPSQGDDDPNPEDPADDTQIAYENLDLARVILEHYRESLVSHRKRDASEAATSTVLPQALALDLAQIRLREGDLHRLEGQYETALADYQACCSLRQQVVAERSDGEAPLLGPYDRKLADVHYNLALTYSLMIAASATTGETLPEAPVAAAAAAPSDLSQAVTLSPEQLDLYRRHASHHYYQCGRTLCGQLAILAQRDADEFFAQVAAALPSFKTTGEEANSLDEHVVPPALARVQLRTLRQHVGQLPLASVDALEMAALLELLEEIQEAMDEAEASEAGVQQVASMKAAITAAAAACHAADDDNQDAGTAAAVGFGSQAAAAASATAQPLMAVRKKKKRPPTEAGQEPNSKYPKSSSE